MADEKSCDLLRAEIERGCQVQKVLVLITVRYYAGCLVDIRHAAMDEIWQGALSPVIGAGCPLGLVDRWLQRPLALRLVVDDESLKYMYIDSAVRKACGCLRRVQFSRDGNSTNVELAQ
jgi:hypothetical protein